MPETTHPRLFVAPSKIHGLGLFAGEDIEWGRRLIEFLGLPWEDAVLRFHESHAPSATASAVQIRRPIYSSSVGRWRHHAERLAPLRNRLAQEIAPVELE